jgi:ferredoxin
MKVSVDRDQCISCSLCWSDCPALFSEDPADGKCSVAEALRLGGDREKAEAPDSLRDAGQSAAANCPISIIHID